MKILTYSLAVLTSASLAGASSLCAQDLPQPSPAAETEQRVGLTDITIAYSSPAVKGRKIWGELVPYGEMWRTGANKATAVTFSTDVKVNGKELKAGSYALFTIPGESEWTIVLSSNTEQWGAGSYKTEEEVLRFNVRPQAAEFRERMLLSVDNATDEGADINIHWEKLRAGFHVDVHTHDQAMKNINSELNGVSVSYRNSARYLVQAGKDLDKAMEWIDQSLALNENWYSTSVKGDIYAAQGKVKEAIETYTKAIAIGEAAAQKDGKTFTYRKDLEADIAKLKSVK